jgi:hypothetical protein
MMQKSPSTQPENTLNIKEYEELVAANNSVMRESVTTAPIDKAESGKVPIATIQSEDGDQIQSTQPLIPASLNQSTCPTINLSREVTAFFVLEVINLMSGFEPKGSIEKKLNEAVSQHSSINLLPSQDLERVYYMLRSTIDLDQDSGLSFMYTIITISFLYIFTMLSYLILSDIDSPSRLYYNAVMMAILEAILLYAYLRVHNSNKRCIATIHSIQINYEDLFSPHTLVRHAEELGLTTDPVMLIKAQTNINLAMQQFDPSYNIILAPKK